MRTEKGNESREKAELKLQSKEDALAVWHCFWETGVSMTERLQWSCTSDGGQQSVWHNPPAIVTIYCCQSIKNKMHALSLDKTCARVQLKWPRLLRLQNFVGANRTSTLFFFFFFHSFKQRLLDWINCFVREAVCMCCVLWCVLSWQISSVRPGALPLQGCFLPLNWNTFVLLTIEIPRDLLESRMLAILPIYLHLYADEIRTNNWLKWLKSAIYMILEILYSTHKTFLQICLGLFYEVLLAECTCYWSFDKCPLMYMWVKHTAIPRSSLFL